MNALEKTKLLKQLKELLNSKKTANGLAKAKILKEILILREQLGFSNSTSKAEPPEQTPGISVFQAVIRGEKGLSIETLTEMIEAAKEDESNPDIVPATQILVDEFNSKLV